MRADPPLTSHREYAYDVASLVKVVDGDTVDLELLYTVDVGFHVRADHRLVQRLRIVGVDTPERGQPGWAEAGNFVRTWFATLASWPLMCTTTKGDSFGRYLADIFDVNGESLSDALLDAGHAVPYVR